MMPKGKNARAHGQGSIWTKPRTRGRSVYVGQVRVGNRQFQRTLGDVRKAGSKDGLTRSMAEARLRVVRDEIEQDLRDAHPSPENPADATLNVVGEAYLDHLESFYRRKRATIQDSRSRRSRRSSALSLTTTSDRRTQRCNRTAALTGLRQGELVALRWIDVDWTTGVIRVRQSYTRGQLGRGKSRSAQRSVPMAPEVARALDEHFKGSAFQADDDLVFAHPHTGHYYDASKLLKRFKATLKTAGVRDVRFHDLRHTFATQVASKGAPLVAIKDWMGHSNIETTMIYADYAPDPHGASWIVNGFSRNNGSDNGGNVRADALERESVA
jgi:integrase